MPIGRSSNGVMETLTIVIVVLLGAVGAFAAQKQKQEHKAVFCQCCGQRLPVTLTDPAPPTKPAQKKPQPTKANNHRDDDAFDIIMPFIF